MSSFMVCADPQMLLGQSNGGGWDWRGVWHVWGREEVRSALLGKPEGKNPFGHAWGYNIEMNLNNI